MRLASIEDLPYIRAALVHHRPSLEKRGFVVEADLETAYNSLLLEIAAGNGYIVQDFLVMASVIKPWYSLDTVVQEWFTMSLKSHPAGVEQIVPFLESLAKRKGSSMIMTGDASKLLEPVWLGCGMLPCGKSFYKRV